KSRNPQVGNQQSAISNQQLLLIVARSPPSALAGRPFVLAGAPFALPVVRRRRLAPPGPPLAAPHPVEDLHEREIDLPHVHVHADYLNLDLVAQTIDLLRVLPAQDV